MRTLSLKERQNLYTTVSSARNLERIFARAKSHWSFTRLPTVPVDENRETGSTQRRRSRVRFPSLPLLRAPLDCA